MEQNAVMVTKEFSITDLPIGAGAAIGAFIRAIYMTASRKLSIIGIRVKLDDHFLNLFSPLGDGESALVSDLILHLTTEPYVILNTGSFLEDASGIYRQTVTVLDNGSTQICKKDFKDFYLAVKEPWSAQWTYNDLIIRLTQQSATPLEITFFIKDCQGNFTQADSNAWLSEYGSIDGVIPVSGCAQRTSKCWFNIKQGISTETLTLFLRGDSRCIDEDFDCIKKVIADYTAKINMLFEK